MSRYRLQPSPVQERVLLEHCGHARFVWNLAVEQHAHWRPGLKPAPGFAEQCRQLTEARAEYEWLRAGSITVQQQALKDFAQAMANFFGRTHRRPTWRRRGRGEGFRIVGGRGRHWDVRRLSRKVGEVRVPKVGWVRFRWSRAVPEGVKSYRITRDAAGRWHVAFAAIPQTILAPGAGAVVGVDRGVAVSAALSTGELLNRPGLRDSEKFRLLRLLRKLARAKPGSTRRARVKAAIARLKARESDRRKDWVEKTSTDLARRFDMIAVEDLKIGNMTRSAKGTIEAPGKHVAAKAGLNRSILAAGWGRLVKRLEHKAPGRVVKVNPVSTSQRCSACGIVDAKSRESQADFRCRSCGYACTSRRASSRSMRRRTWPAAMPNFVRTWLAALPLSQHAEQEVLHADVVVSEAQRFAQRQRQRLPCPRGERNQLHSLDSRVLLDVHRTGSGAAGHVPVRDDLLNDTARLQGQAHDFEHTGLPPPLPPAPPPRSPPPDGRCLTSAGAAETADATSSCHCPYAEGQVVGRLIQERRNVPGNRPPDFRGKTALPGMHDEPWRPARFTIDAEGYGNHTFGPGPAHRLRPSR